MCGIVGIYNSSKSANNSFNAPSIQSSNIVNDLLDCLNKIEYRGYDASGIAVFDNLSNKILQIRSIGEVQQLINTVNNIEFDFNNANVCIGHTRWSTIGSANNINNVHPHVIDNIAIVHNGTIENISQHRCFLLEKGYSFNGETDTEVALKLIHYYNQTLNIIDAFAKVKEILHHNFTALLMHYDQANKPTLISSCGDISLMLGLLDNGFIISSDIGSIADKTFSIVELSKGDIVVINDSKYQIIDILGNYVERSTNQSFNKIGYSYTSLIQYDEIKDYMYKEILQQKHILFDSYSMSSNQVSQNIIEMINSANSMYIFSCGSSHYAGDYFARSLRRIGCKLNIVSEVSTDHIEYNIQEGDVVILLTQSGETNDTIKALRYAKAKKANVISIVNSELSTISRESDNNIYTKVGLEISVAATKSFSSQLVTLFALLEKLAPYHADRNGLDLINQASKEIHNINDMISESIEHADNFIKNNEHVIKKISSCRFVFFIGCGLFLPIAKEGALKLKEIGYIPCEGMQGGEVKHGSLALASEDVFCIAFAANSNNRYIYTCIDNLDARNSESLLITSNENAHKECNSKHNLLIGNAINDLISPIVLTPAVQLIAYRVGKMLGNTVDRPRNLSKSITTE